jgi:hypothetical protein
VELRLEGARWLAWTWALWCFALGLAVWAGVDLDAGTRLALIAVVAVMGWRGFRSLRRRGESRRLHWEPDGRWRLEDGREPVTYVQPGAPRRLGAIVWISWRQGSRERYFHADGIVVEPKSLTALKARTKFAGQSRCRSTHESLP